MTARGHWPTNRENNSARMHSLWIQCECTQRGSGRWCNARFMFQMNHSESLGITWNHSAMLDGHYTMASCQPLELRTLREHSVIVRVRFSVTFNESNEIFNETSSKTSNETSRETSNQTSSKLQVILCQWSSESLSDFKKIKLFRRFNWIDEDRTASGSWFHNNLANASNWFTIKNDWQFGECRSELEVQKIWSLELGTEIRMFWFECSEPNVKSRLFWDVLSQMLKRKFRI